jgi:hypothetical protein
MRSLRLFRSNSAQQVASTDRDADNGGLLAFAPEARAAQPSRPQTRPPHSHVLTGILAALVLLQAWPTALWVKSRVLGSTVSASEAAPPTAVAVAPPPVMAAAPCDPAPEPVPAAAPAADATRTAAPAPAMVAGLLSVDAPVALHVYLRGKLVGTTEADTIMLPVGTHDLALENGAVGFKLRRSVTVQAGRTTSVKIDPPSGVLHVNALPWAEVWIDNQRAGETPIGNVQAPIGTREIVFRHPELGERRTTVLVTLKGPARVSMDMRAK